MQQQSPKTFWTKVWESRAAWAGTFSVVGALGSFILLQSVDSLRNIRVLPSEAKETYNTFLSWYFDDAKWTGTWFSREEGNVEDYRQAALPIELHISAERGKVFGEMFNRDVCKLNPLLPPVLVEGEVKGDVLVAYAFAYVHGERNLLYTFKVEHEPKDPVITVRPLRNPLNLLPDAARLVRRMDTHLPSTVPSTGPVAAHPDLVCPESPAKYLSRLRKEGKLPNVKDLDNSPRQLKPPSK